MKIQSRKTDELIPYERNQKKHDDKQIANVANSIKRFGWQQPIVVDSKDVVIIGHCRLLAAKKLGLKEVPVVVADDLTEDEVRELRIADNKTNESPWDLNLLDADIAELSFDGFDFDFMSVSPDDFGDSFSLPSGDKPEICNMTFTLHQKQKELIDYALQITKEDVSETFGNTNINGNALYEVVRQWAELKK